MELDDVRSQLQAFIETSFPHPGAELTASTSLLNGWFIDSLGIVQTVVFLEQQFGCDVRAADVNATNFHSIETLAAYVLERAR